MYHNFLPRLLTEATRRVHITRQALCDISFVIEWLRSPAFWPLFQQPLGFERRPKRCEPMENHNTL